MASAIEILLLAQFEQINTLSAEVATLSAAVTSLTGQLAEPSWTPMSLASPWGDIGGSQVTAQYRKWTLTNEVEIIGAISTSGSNTGIWFTLPSGYIPAREQQFACGTGGGSAAGNGPYVQADTSGNLTFPGPPTGSTEFFFHGWISLDA